MSELARLRTAVEACVEVMNEAEMPFIARLLVDTPIPNDIRGTLERIRTVQHLLKIRPPARQRVKDVFENLVQVAEAVDSAR